MLSVGHRICRLYHLQLGKTPEKGVPVGRGWISIRSEDGILVVECLIGRFNGMSTHLGHVMPKRTMSKTMENIRQ